VTKKNQDQKKPPQSAALPVLMFNGVVGGLGGLYASTGSITAVASIGIIAVFALWVVRWWGGS
jgi:hypothetical protein